MVQNENNGSEKKNGIGIVDTIWRWLSSIKLALILILILGGTGLIGTFASVDFFHSEWAWIFMIPGALLMVNIMVCSINRWGSIMHLVRGGSVNKNSAFYTGGNLHAEINDVSQAVDHAVKIPVDVFKGRGYRVRLESDDSGTYLIADKNRYFRLGTYVSHLSLILLVLAYLIGSFLGFRDEGFVVAEGETQEVGHNTNQSLKLVSFADEYYPDGMPKDYRSSVILYENGQEVEQALIRVNHPLSYKGIRYYQSFFGPAVSVRVTSGGTEIFSGSIPLTDQLQGGIPQYAGAVFLTQGIVVRVINSAGPGDTMIPPGSVAFDVRQNGAQVALKLAQQGVPLVVNDLELTYISDTEYSGFQVSRDPGNALFWIATIMFMVGIILIFYFPYRQAWVMVQSQRPGNSRILARLGTSRGPGGESELKSLVSLMEQKIHAKSSRKG